MYNNLFQPIYVLVVLFYNINADDVNILYATLSNGISKYLII